MKINPDDPRLALRYSAGRAQFLTVVEECETVYRVSSHSVPGLFHRVVIDPEGITCTCASTSACTHRALALAESSLSKWREYRDAECIRFNEDRFERQSKLWWKVYERQRAHAEMMVELMAA